MCDLDGEEAFNELCQMIQFDPYAIESARLVLLLFTAYFLITFNKKSYFLLLLFSDSEHSTTDLPYEPITPRGEGHKNIPYDPKHIRTPETNSKSYAEVNTSSTGYTTSCASSTATSKASHSKRGRDQGEGHSQEQSVAASNVDSASSKKGKAFQDLDGAHPATELSADDPRRKMAPLFAEAFYAGDVDRIGRLIMENCTEDYVLILRHIGSSSPYGLDYVEVIGQSAAIKFWGNFFLAIPDTMYDLLDTRIRISTTGYSTITSKIVVHGTQAMDMVTDTNRVVIVTNPEETPDGRINDDLLAFSVDGEKNVLDQAPTAKLVGSVKKQHRRLNMVGTVTYYCDPNKKMYRCEFIHSVCGPSTKESKK